LEFQNDFGKLKAQGGRRQVVKAAACGAAIRGFESPRSPSNIFRNQFKNLFSKGKNQ
tara:strand:+ start:554 stop:724 length:171 start_codon:yes stop_codon:yes gene_type:complete